MAIATGIERGIELLILGVVALPLARMVADSGVRRRFQAFPRVQLAMVAVLSIYVAGIAVILVLWPWLLRVGAVAALAAIAVERWQARPRFGLKRGLPPGSLGVMPVGPWRNPDFYFEQIDRHGPVFKFRHFVYPAIGIAGFERAGDFFRANNDRLQVPPAPFNSVVPGGFIRYLGETRHEDIAGVLRSVLSAGVVDAAHADLAREARHALSRLASDGTAPPVREMDRMVRNVMMRCFYGVTAGARLDRLDAQYSDANYLHLARSGQKRTAAAVFGIIRDVRALAVDFDNDASLARPSFLSELVRLHPDLVTNDEVMGNFVYTLHTGRLDATGLMVWLLVRLAGEPVWAARLDREAREERAATVKSGGLADRFVRETLRLHQSEFLLRRVTQGISWNGLEIPKGWYVRVCVQESHRDPALFEDPSVFNPDRFLNPPNKTRYSPFGMAGRLCPGEHVSRALGANLVAEAAARYDVAISRDGPLEFSGFHWRPGPLVRVGLTARA